MQSTSNEIQYIESLLWEYKNEINSEIFETKTFFAVTHKVYDKHHPDGVRINGRNYFRC